MTIVATAREVGTAYPISFVGRRGTCFAWKDEKGSFFVTASHLLKGAEGGDHVTLQRAADTVAVQIREIVFSPEPVDVCVFSTQNFSLALNGEFPTDSRAMVFPGGEVLFVGYPHGLISTHPNTDGFASALVRKASFSGTTEVGGHHLIVLDGFNNPGYSGGPAYFGYRGKLFPLGVISGYRYELPTQGTVFRKVGGVEEPVSDYYVKGNSGMIYAEPWGHVVECAAALPSRNPLRRSLPAASL